jgi:hypothetical protein
MTASATIFVHFCLVREQMFAFNSRQSLANRWSRVVTYWNTIGRGSNAALQCLASEVDKIMNPPEDNMDAMTRR